MSDQAIADWRQVKPHPSSWAGRMTDGRSAASYAVDVTFGADGLALSWPGAEGPSTTWPYANLTTAEPIRATSVDVLFATKTAPGATVFVADPTFAQALAQRAPQTALKASRLAGLKPGAAAGAAAFSVVAAIYALDLSPSKALARAMPETARQKLGANVLASLPITRTCAEPEGRAALDVLVTRLRPGAKTSAVNVVEWPDVINAFAVPGGNVVLTRKIIEKASSPDEIAGVLAHEIGHTLELHPEAGLVRSVGFWALIQMVFTGTPGALGNVGNLLAQLAYTRVYEREADAIALQLLKDAKVSHRPFASFFRKIDTQKDDPQGSKRRRAFSNTMFESHPPTAERIATIERQPDYPATPSLTAAQWQALRQICGASPTGMTAPTGVATTGTDIKPAQPNTDERLKAATARVTVAPNDAAAYQTRGEIYLTDKRYGEAVADFTRAQSLAPAVAIHSYNRGRAHHSWNKHDEAIADYRQAIKLNPKYSLALAARAAVYRVQNKPDAAFQDLEAALAANPRLEYGFYQRGLVNASVNRWADSERDFGKVIELNKAYAYAYVRRAEALEKLNQRDKAIADYRFALLASPSSTNAADAFKIARSRLAALGVAEKP